MGLLILTGCATGPKFLAAPEPESDKSLIYIYRPWLLVAGAGSPTIHINDEFTVDLTNGGYTRVTVSPGGAYLRIKPPPTIFQVDWSGSVFVDTKPGETYYVRWTPHVIETQPLPTGGLYVRTKGDLRTVSESLGRGEILKTNFIDLDPVKSE